jgi:hypothetical protein
LDGMGEAGQVEGVEEQKWLRDKGAERRIHKVINAV